MNVIRKRLQNSRYQWCSICAVRILVILLIALVISCCSRDSSANSSEVSGAWLDEFFSLYGELDGRHLDYYADDVELVDESAGATFTGKKQLAELLEQAQAAYTDLHWQIDEQVVQGNTSVVRGRAVGVAFGQEFDVAFCTWLIVENKKIIRQVDYVDYTTLRTQLAEAADNPNQESVEKTRGENMAKVTGIGGVFLLSNGKGSALSAWYQKHLGLQMEDFGGAILKWEDDPAEDNGVTIWHAAEHDSDWFKPSDARFMINYRVDDLEKMVAQFEAEGVELLQGPEYHENGVFAWLLDPAGNKIELWEPKNWDEKNKR